MPTPADDPVVQRLLEDYLTSRELGFVGGTYRRAPVDPAAFAPPNGVFLVVHDDEGRPVGCGAVRMLSPERAEVKHLWLDPAARGRGWSRILLAELEERAVEFGAREVVLDTNATLEAAQSLYRTSGYREIPPYNENPNATHWFGKSLPAGAQYG